MNRTRATLLFAVLALVLWTWAFDGGSFESGAGPAPAPDVATGVQTDAGEPSLVGREPVPLPADSLTRNLQNGS